MFLQFNDSLAMINHKFYGYNRIELVVYYK